MSIRAFPRRHYSHVKSCKSLIAYGSLSSRPALKHTLCLTCLYSIDYSSEVCNLLTIPEWTPDKWRDVPENPLIDPPGGPKPGNVIGDPQVIPPGEYDEYWHMFAHAGRTIYHLRSSDGIHWRYEETLPWPGCLVYLYKEKGIWYMVYTLPDEKWNTRICIRESRNLKEWSDEVVLLEPQLPWECEGPFKQVRNPCLIRTGDGTYRLYYSAGTILLEDCGYEEPKYISFAESDDIYGPYKHYGKPIISPDPKVSYRNFGAGALKVYRWRDQYIGFNNGIYKDEKDRSRSAICLMASLDGISWIDAPFNPIIPPTSGWKRALVYQLDVVFGYEEKIIIYYNARDGWREGVERIGASILVEE
ncbi:MAG: glycosyl hydrolase family 43 [Thermoprotei archaeon]|mgnify:CR=1 FL=1|nr:MAG: glycosyl hydrolase family 43 [Thermoprotei archaeon]